MYTENTQKGKTPKQLHIYTRSSHLSSPEYISSGKRAMGDNVDDDDGGNYKKTTAAQSNGERTGGDAAKD